MNHTHFLDLFSAIATASWRASWFVIALLVLRLALRRRVPARVWPLAWLLVAARLLLPVTLDVAWLPARIASMASISWKLPAVVTAARHIAPAAGQTAALPARSQAAENSPPAVPNFSPTTGTLLISEPAAKTPVRPTEASAPTAPWSAMQTAAAVWMSGMAVLLLARIGMILHWRAGMKAHRCEDARLSKIVAEEARRLRLKHVPPIWQTAAIRGPALYGLFRPRLLLPPGLPDQLSDDELRFVVRHELTHFRRGDLLIQALVHGAAIAHWFNPAVWLAGRLARIDCELACDEGVLRREPADSATAYGATLLKVLGIVGVRRAPVSAVAILEDRRQLRQRLERIATFRSTSVLRMIAASSLVFALAGLSVIQPTRAREPAVSTGRAELPMISARTATMASKSDTPPAAPSPPAPDELDQQRERVKQLARELRALEGNSPVSIEERRSVIAATLKALSMESANAATALAAAEAKAKQIDDCQEHGGVLAEIPFIASQPLVANLSQQLVTVKARVANLRQRYRERHPVLISVLREQASNEQELARAVNAACLQVRAELESARTALAHTQEQLRQTKDASLELDRTAAEYAEKKQALKENERVLLDLMQNEVDGTALLASLGSAKDTAVLFVGRDHAQTGTAMTFTGGARAVIKRGGESTTITAAEITIDSEKNMLSCGGECTISRDGRVYKARDLTIDFGSESVRRIVLDRGRITISPGTDSANVSTPGEKASRAPAFGDRSQFKPLFSEQMPKMDYSATAQGGR